MSSTVSLMLLRLLSIADNRLGRLVRVALNSHNGAQDGFRVGHEQLGVLTDRIGVSLHGCHPSVQFVHAVL